MSCPRCSADPFRDIHGSDRQVLRVCAFDDRGRFTPENWCCLTLSLLAQYAGPPQFDTHTNSLRILPLDPSSDKGWLVLTAHGWKHRIVSAVHVGDHVPRTLTLALADRAIAYCEVQAALARALQASLPGMYGRRIRA